MGFSDVNSKSLDKLPVYNFSKKANLAFRKSILRSNGSNFSQNTENTKEKSSKFERRKSVKMILNVSDKNLNE